MADKKPKADKGPKLPYLAIRNWAKFQSTTDKHGRTLEGKSRPYIRDYCDKETDSQYAALGICSRYMFDACRRLRGKHGRNLPNDHMWILRQLDVDPTERGRATHAIQTLIARGLLIPSNQQFDVPQQPETPIEVDLDLKVNVKSLSQQLESSGNSESSDPPGEKPAATQASKTSQASQSQTQQPNPRGAAPNPAEASRLETPGNHSPVNSATPRPHSAAPRQPKGHKVVCRFLNCGGPLKGNKPDGVCLKCGHQALGQADKPVPPEPECTTPHNFPKGRNLEDVCLNPGCETNRMGSMYDSSQKFCNHAPAAKGATV